MPLPIQVWLRGVGNSNLDNEENVSWITLGWFVDGIGFGELQFEYDHLKSTWTCDTETMSREFVQTILKTLGEVYTEKKEGTNGEMDEGGAG